VRDKLSYPITGKGKTIGLIDYKKEEKCIQGVTKVLGQTPR
jgi:hypothetical protein